MARTPTAPQLGAFQPGQPDETLVVKTAEFTAPTYTNLRPCKQPISRTFPVYRDLVDRPVKAKHDTSRSDQKGASMATATVESTPTAGRATGPMSFVNPHPGITDRLLRAADHPDPVIAYVLATLSAYSYSPDIETFTQVAASLGLDGYRCVTYQEFVDVMFIDSNAYVLQSADGRVVILVYRGTNLASLVNWLVDLDVDPQKVAIEFDDRQGESYLVHRGFYRNLLATFDQVAGALGRALNQQSVTLDDKGEPTGLESPMQALYITGHSLGAAMAAMAALRLRTDEPYLPIFETLKAVYTYGQPMIGDTKLARRCDEPGILQGKLIRYAFGHDAAPQLPPKASGDFSHFGREFRHPSNERRGGWQEHPNTRQLRNLWELALVIPSFLARQLRLTRNVRFGVSVDDHLPWHYTATLSPAADDAEPLPPPTTSRRRTPTRPGARVDGARGKVASTNHR